MEATSKWGSHLTSSPVRIKLRVQGSHLKMFSTDPTNGTFFQWANAALGVQHSFAIEVRPSLDDWFIGDMAPEGFIALSGQELFAGVYAGLRAALVT